MQCVGVAHAHAHSRVSHESRSHSKTPVYIKTLFTRSTPLPCVCDQPKRHELLHPRRPWNVIYRAGCTGHAEAATTSGTCHRREALTRECTIHDEVKSGILSYLPLSHTHSLALSQPLLPPKHHCREDETREAWRPIPSQNSVKVKGERRRARDCAKSGRMRVCVNIVGECRAQTVKQWHGLQAHVASDETARPRAANASII
jgi:hypothetical protein